MLAKTAKPTEGVSCESCHGAAGDWIRAHTRQDYTHAQRVEAGIRDLRNLYVRANSCVACHEAISPDILEAGHPTLHFELAAQTEIEPPHWLEAENYHSLNAWLTGQAVALREVSWHLAKGEGKSAPEMLRRWDALCWLLRKVTATVHTFPKISAEASQPDYFSIQKQADELARLAPGVELPNPEIRVLLIQLAQSASELNGSKSPKTPDKGTDYERAFAAVCAMDRLTIALHLDKQASIANALTQLRQDLLTHGTFIPEDFAKHATALKNEYITSSPK
jgi:hypothetical protein